MVSIVTMVAVASKLIIEQAALFAPVNLKT